MVERKMTICGLFLGVSLVFTMIIAGESKLKLSLPGIGMTAACYGVCMGECMTSKKCDKAPATWASCGRECTAKCAFAATAAARSLNLSSIDYNTSHQYCELGCSTSMCSPYLNEEKKVGSCMGSCSNKCTKNYSP